MTNRKGSRATSAGRTRRHELATVVHRTGTEERLTRNWARAGPAPCVFSKTGNYYQLRLRGFTGLRSIGGAYKQLARLRSAGHRSLVDFGYLSIISSRWDCGRSLSWVGKRSEGVAEERTDGSITCWGYLQSDVRRRDKRLTVLVTKSPGCFRTSWRNELQDRRSRRSRPPVEYPWTRSFWSAEREQGFCA